MSICNKIRNRQDKIKEIMAKTFENKFKKISITPISPKMQRRAEAVFILNSFQKRNINFRAFVSIVQEVIPKYEDFSEAIKLQAFWNLRAFDPVLVTDMNLVLETLKSE